MGISSIEFSEEQDVDCDMVQAAKFGSQYGGCNGGSYNYVWQYLSAAGGSQSTSSYGPYTAGTTGAVCNYYIIFYKHTIYNP